MAVHCAPEYFRNPVHRITVDLVGLGGTGSKMLTNLGRINAALVALDHPGLDVRAWDPDEISEANMGRQMFSPADYGLNKSQVLVTRINRFFGTSFTSMPCKYDGLKTSNILVTCVDSAAARLEISKYRIENAGQHPTDKQYYWMDIGNLQQTGQVILGTNGKITQRAARLLNAVSSLPNVVQAFPQLKKVKEADQGPSCSMAEALDRQDLFINSVLAEFAGNLLWKLLRKGLIEYRGCYVNLETLTVNPIKI